MNLQQIEAQGINVDLDKLIKNFENNDTVTCTCNQEGCENEVTVYRQFAGQVACSECVQAWEERRRISALSDFWHGGNGKPAFCPQQFRETDPKHEDFAPVWKLVKMHADLKTNLVFCGSSGRCKTRAMMLRLKVAYSQGLSIDVLWADDLEAAFESRKMGDLRERLMIPKVLGIDDFLTSGSSLERVTSFLKGVIDARLRDSKTTILTTNLAARDIESDSQKYGNATKADQHRVQAVIRRLRGEFRMVDFDSMTFDRRF